MTSAILPTRERILTLIILKNDYLTQRKLLETIIRQNLTAWNSDYDLSSGRRRIPYGDKMMEAISPRTKMSVRIAALLKLKKSMRRIIRELVR